ncbi:MAG: tetratricopeptide repeat protein [Candidatus Eisenbacteria bacterium]
MRALTLACVACLLFASLPALAEDGTSLARGGLDAGDATRAFAQANALYSEERFDEAAAVYEAILDGGFRNADVEYNLGNAHYKSGRLGPAVLAYERALGLDPSHEDAAANLAFLGELLADRRTPVGGSVSESLAGLSARFTVGRLAFLASVFYFTLFFALIWGVLRGPAAQWARRLALVMVVHLAVSGGILAFKVAQTRANVEAVILAAEVGVRTGPGDDFLLEFRLHEGTKVRLSESRADESGDEWARVAVAGTDLEGWLPANAIERI